MEFNGGNENVFKAAGVPYLRVDGYMYEIRDCRMSPMVDRAFLVLNAAMPYCLLRHAVVKYQDELNGCSRRLLWQSAWAARSPHAEIFCQPFRWYATGECFAAMAARLRLWFTSNILHQTRIGMMVVRRSWISMHQGAPENCGLEDNEMLLDLQPEPRYSQSIY